MTRRDFFEFVEVRYHRERCHSSLVYCTPVEYEDQLAYNARRVRRTA
ncbi:MAG: hypothetical protein Q8K82_00130 [Gemmatimonadaceae bacterium]|nr:hypothetical protein [Gemmatimonadaceae bacterium]